MSNVVKLNHAALSEAMVNGESDIILRGEIDLATINNLNVDRYQREVLPITKINSLINAFRSGGVPCIYLGMRGHRVKEVSANIFALQDPIYIVDGLQRTTAVREMIQRGDLTARLGAEVYFGTNELWERAKFKELNANRIKLSPNILLRNLRNDIPAIEMLWNLVLDSEFALYKRVAWEQRMKRHELLVAPLIAKVINTLHSHWGPGRSSHNVDELANNMQRMMKKIGRKVMHDNIMRYFEVIDQCWGIRNVTFKEGATYLRGSFMRCLAALFASHRNFWTDKAELAVDRDVIAKIRIFPIRDPQVIGLSSSSGRAQVLLYQLMVDHINSGRRKNRLQGWNSASPATPSEALGVVNNKSQGEEESGE